MADTIFVFSSCISCQYLPERNLCTCPVPQFLHPWAHPLMKEVKDKNKKIVYVQILEYPNVPILWSIPIVPQIHTIQRYPQIQYNPNQNSNAIFQRSSTKNSKIGMKSQKISKYQNNPGSTMFLISDYIAKVWLSKRYVIGIKTYRLMAQNIQSKNKVT